MGGGGWEVVKNECDADRRRHSAVVPLDIIFRHSIEQSNYTKKLPPHTGP